MLTSEFFLDNKLFATVDHVGIPLDVQGNWLKLCNEAIAMIEAALRDHPVRRIRLHGDCHAGNVLWNDAGPHFVDFDDARRKRRAAAFSSGSTESTKPVPGPKAETASAYPSATASSRTTTGGSR